MTRLDNDLISRTPVKRERLIMSASNCSTCKYKEINKDKNYHCYMFKEEPKDKCMQWKGVNVGTIGHHSHSKSMLLNAMLALAIQNKKD